MFKKLGSNIIIYGLTNGLKSLVPFIMLPILTRYLSVKDYGILSLIEVTILFLFPFISLNINSAINVEYFHLGKKRLSLYITNAFLLSLLSGVVFFFLFFTVRKDIANFLNLDETIIIWLPIFALLRVVSSVVSGIYQVSNKPLEFAIYTIFQTIIDFIFSYIFVVWYHYGYIGRLTGVYISFFLASIYGIVILYKNNYIVFRFILLFSKKILTYGAPLIPHVVGGVILALSDRYFISYFIGNEAVGLYSVAYQISSIMLLLSISVNQAWVPFFYRLLTDFKENKAVIFRYIRLLMIFYTICGLILYILSPFLYDLFIDQKFHNSKLYFPVLLVGLVFQSYYYLYTNFLFFYKKTTVLAKITFFASLVNLVLNFININIFGVIGVAYATLITYILYFLLIYIYVRNTLKFEVLI